MEFNNIRQFLKLESLSGIILLIAAVLAMICSNSPLSEWYNNFLSLNVSFHIEEYSLSKPLLLWINEGLMAIFFLLVGLELKREIFEGSLRGFRSVIFPVLAALGGMVAPALIYIYLNSHNPILFRGWAIPTATDIAFALGVLMLFSHRVSITLKLFLMTLAIIDDIGAIAIIAIFHTRNLSYESLLFASFFIVVLVIMNRLNVRKLSLYVFVGVLLWICVLKSGVHATLTGVILAFTIPLKRREEHEEPPLCWLEKKLHPWAAYCIMPLFAFANAGLSFKGITFSSFLEPIPLGIFLGLFVGKQAGIMFFSWIAVKLKWTAMPKHCNWLDLYGVSLICGIGFTMSLFIGSLAFSPYPHYLMEVRLGVFTGSLLSGILGYLVLFYSLKRHVETSHLR